MPYLPHAEAFARVMVLTSRSMMPHDEPARMTIEECEECGESFTRPKGRRFHHCPDCKIARSVAAQQNASDKQGPMYERLVRGQYLHWLGEVNRLNITFDQEQ